MHSVFISYSRRDYVDENENVIPGNPISKIMDALDNAGISYWIDKNGIFSGDEFKDILTKAIEDAEVFLFISSKFSNASKWTAKEINVAVYENKKIIPILIDDARYNSSVKFDLLGLDYIDMKVNISLALLKLVESLTKLLPSIDLAKVRSEIEEARKKAAQLYEEQRLLFELMAEKMNLIGYREHICPVCGSATLVTNHFCSVCGWNFIPYEDVLNEGSRQHYYSHLKNSKAVWESLKRGGSSNLSEQSERNTIPPIIEKMIENMIEVSGGTVTLGATREQEEDAFYDESPAHKVTLSPFYIGKHPVTQEEWVAVMGDNPSNFVGNNRPVDSVNWYDCQKFISKLNEITNMQFRFPTEAEWEYAARGGKRSKGYRYSGGNLLGSVAWYENNSDGQTHEVGQKSPNELGIYDMSGNVWEWCQDWKGDYLSELQTDPQGPEEGDEKVLRGGGWNREPRGCRVSYRGDDKPELKYCSIGLRLVMSKM